MLRMRIGVQRLYLRPPRAAGVLIRRLVVVPALASESPPSVSVAHRMVARRRLDPVSIWDRESVLDIFHREGIKEVHADNIWCYIGRVPSTPLSQVR